ncbi:maleylpyruvate isomerase N-terminal domain-containing protein [Streptomyces zhihengii]
MKWLEATGAVLDRLSPADRQDLGRLLRRAADRHPAGPWRDELQRLPEGFGLDDDQHELYCTDIEHLMRRFTAVVTDVDPATPVTTCPGWTFADLVRHHGTTHRWAAHVVRVRASEAVGEGRAARPPRGPGRPPRWAADAAEEALAVLRKVDPDTRSGRTGPTSGSPATRGGCCSKGSSTSPTRSSPWGGNRTSPRVRRPTESRSSWRTCRTCRGSPTRSPPCPRAPSPSGPWTPEPPGPPPSAGRLLLDPDRCAVALGRGHRHRRRPAAPRVRAPRPGDRRLTVSGDAAVLSGWLAATVF